MAKCVICGKETSFGNQLSITRSHISKRTVRPVKPNLRTVKADVDGEIKRILMEKLRKFLFVQNAYVLEKLREQVKWKTLNFIKDR